MHRFTIILNLSRIRATRNLHEPSIKEKVSLQRASNEETSRTKGQRTTENLHTGRGGESDGVEVRFDGRPDQQVSGFQSERPVGIVSGWRRWWTGCRYHRSSLSLDLVVPSAPKWVYGLCRGNPARGSIFFRDKRRTRPGLFLDAGNFGLSLSGLFILNGGIT